MATQPPPETHPYSDRTIRERTYDLSPEQVQHLTCFDQELIRGAVDRELDCPLSNGRQIARGPAGERYVLMESRRDGLLLSCATRPAARTDCFAEPVLLVGVTCDGVLGRATGAPSRAGIAVNGVDAVLCWSDGRGVWLAHGRMGADGITWSPAACVAEGAMADDVCVHRDGRVMVLCHDANVLQMLAINGDTRELTDNVCDATVTSAVMCLGLAGDVHVAYAQTDARPWRINKDTSTRLSETIWYRHKHGNDWHDAEQVTYSVTQWPTMTLWRGRPLIVFQTDGVKEVVPGAPDYLYRREGGGSGVGYALRDGESWRIGEIQRASEILVAEGRGHDVFAGQVYPAIEAMHRPRVGVDGQGVPWAVWSNTTRRHTYASRWLGHGFGQSQELRGGWYALSHHVNVEAAAPPGTDQLSMVTLAADRLYHTPAAVPSLRADSGHRFLFLDLHEVDEMRGVEQIIGQFERYTGNPVFTPGPPGAWDDLLVFWPVVWPTEDGYLMQYQAAGTRMPGTNTVMGLARSTDGIHWHRPALGVVNIEGQPDNNCIPWVVFFRDDDEPDSSRRYKGARCDSLWTTNPRRVAVHSHDAIHWIEDGDMQHLECMHEACGPSFRDPYDVPARRFKAVGRTCSDEGRTPGMMWSADGIHWDGFEAFLDIHDPYGKPAGAWRGRYNAHRFLHPLGEPTAQQIYWNTVWIEHGLYLCLYSPMHWDGGYDVAMAVSRDGYRWTRVCGGAPLLQRQPIGARESGHLFVGYGNARPIRFGNRLRLYYAAGPSHHGLHPHAQYEASGIGFAELRPDAWTAMQLQRDQRDGIIRTLPIDVPAGAFRLCLNVDGLTGEGSEAFSVELLDAATCEVLPGYKSSVLVQSADDALRTDVQWKGGPITGPRTVRLRFTIRSMRVKLHAFWFEPLT